MRLLSLLLAATALAAPALAAPAPAAPAPAQPRQVADAAAVRPAQAPGLEALFKAADRGETETLQRALAVERDADLRVLLDARLAAMRLDPAAGADPRLRALAAEGRPAEKRVAALEILSSLAFSGGDYAEAARLARTLEALQTEAGKTDAAEATAMARVLAEMLAGEPRQALQRSVARGRSAARRDPAGLMRVDMKVDGRAQDAVLDTGANLSVLSAATARRLGVRVIEGDGRVGNSVRGTVAVRVGMADRLEIGGNVLRNVAFLIIDDAALTFGGGRYTIPAIIGYPVMQALGRFRVERDSFTVEPAGRAASAGDGHNLHAWANELFVDTEVGGVKVPLHLDSGANPSHLNALFADLHPDKLAGLPREQRRLAGAGGTATGQAVRWLDVPVAIAGRRFRAPSVLVGVSGGADKPSPYYGVVGADLLASFASYTVDLRTMRLELGAPAR